MSDSIHRSSKNRDVIVIDDDESAATENDAVPTPPISSQEHIELLEKLSKTERQLQKACRIAREAELRAERAENLLDSKHGILDVVKKERDEEFERRLADVSEQLEEIKRKENIANGKNNEMMRRLAELKSESNELRIDAEMEGRATPSIKEISMDIPVKNVNIRPVRSVSRPKRYIDSQENSNGDRKQLMKKKSKSEARPRSRKVGIREWKRSETEMQCHECEFHTRIVRSWDWHIREIHNTTPSVAGVFLRCECGYEGLSHKHILACKLANFIVIGRDGEPIRRKSAKESSIDNAIEEMNIRPVRSVSRPKRYIDYNEDSDEDTESPANETVMEDVKKINKDSPTVDRGRKRKVVVSHPSVDSDTKKPRLAIRRRDTESECSEPEPIPQTPQCVLCEKYPKTTRGYTDHLQNYHHSTLTQNRIYLICSCGLEVLSGWQRLHMHREMCDGSKFSLRSLDTN